MAKRVMLALAILLATLSCNGMAYGQGMPTAVQQRQLSVFAGGTFVDTGLDDGTGTNTDGTNVSFTGGVDYAFLNYHQLRPVIEIRGTYPIRKGPVDAQKSIMGGLRLDVLVGRRYHPYVDAEFGRGSTTYPTGYIYQNFLYELTTNYVYSGGVGIDYDLTEHFGVKADAQIQRWGSAPLTPGTIYPKVGTVALVYRFDFNHHYRR
jgi:hypothetical protein